MPRGGAILEPMGRANRLIVDVHEPLKIMLSKSSQVVAQSPTGNVSYERNVFGRSLTVVVAPAVQSSMAPGDGSGVSIINPSGWDGTVIMVPSAIVVVVRRSGRISIDQSTRNAIDLKDEREQK